MRALITPFANPNAKWLSYLFLAHILLAALVIFVAPASGSFPSLIDIAVGWDKLAREHAMLRELFASAIMIAQAIVISALITFILTMLAATVMFKMSITWLTGLRFLGFSGITYLFTMWTSDGASLKLWLLVFGMTPFLLTSALSVLASIKTDEIDYARSLKLDGWSLAWELYAKGKLADNLDLVRQNAAMGWTLLSMVEGILLGAGGIGALLLTQSKHLYLSQIFAIQLTILAYGLFQDFVLRWIRKIVCPYTNLPGSKA